MGRPRNEDRRLFGDEGKMPEFFSLVWSNTIKHAPVGRGLTVEFEERNWTLHVPPVWNFFVAVKLPLFRLDAIDSDRAVRLDSNQSAGGNRRLSLCLLFSYFWVTLTLGYVVCLTNSGLDASWYFLNGTEFMPS
jgi:hypothetical protein